MIVTHNKTYSLGEVKEKTVQNITFDVGFSKKIIKVTPGCGCTTIKITNDTIVTKLDVGTIPHHLAKMKGQPFKKRITILFEDGTEEFLYIEGFKIK